MAAKREERTIANDLPDEALVNILRCFSEDPHHPAWMRLLNFEALVAFAQAEHPLHGTAVAVVKVLCIARDHNGSTEIDNKLLDAYGRTCPTLGLFNSQASSELVLQCTNVKMLDISNLPPAISLSSLVSVQTNLDEMYATRSLTDATAEAFLEHGHGLKGISLSVYADELEEYCSWNRTGSCESSTCLTMRMRIGFRIHCVPSAKLLGISR